MYGLVALITDHCVTPIYICYVREWTMLFRGPRSVYHTRECRESETFYLTAAAAAAAAAVRCCTGQQFRWADGLHVNGSMNCGHSVIDVLAHRVHIGSVVHVFYLSVHFQLRQLPTKIENANLGAAREWETERTNSGINKSIYYYYFSTLWLLELLNRTPLPIKTERLFRFRYLFSWDLSLRWGCTGICGYLLSFSMFFAWHSLLSYTLVFLIAHNDKFSSLRRVSMDFFGCAVTSQRQQQRAHTFRHPFSLFLFALNCITYISNRLSALRSARVYGYRNTSIHTPLCSLFRLDPKNINSILMAFSIITFYFVFFIFLRFSRHSPHSRRTSREIEKLISVFGDNFGSSKNWNWK